MKRKSSVLLSPFANPLPVQFWLLGLDARTGLLRERGFVRTPEERGGRPYGSSRHRLNGLELHSSGLTLHLPAGVLCYDRPRQSFRLGGEPLPRSTGLELLQPHVHEHEAWVERQCAGLRTRQLGAALPRPVRQQVGVWHLWVTRALELELWRPLGPSRPGPIQVRTAPLAEAGVAAHAGQRP